MEPTFAPSEVRVQDRYLPTPAGSYLPFVGTFKKTEAEIAAALIVRTCEANGDRWQPVSLQQAQEVLKRDFAEERKPWAEWGRNPFARPDVWKLVEYGFAKWSDGEGGSLVFTESGFAELARYVWPKKKETP